MNKNKSKLYAKALAEVILEGRFEEKQVVENFVKLLALAGQEKKAKQILEMAQDLVLAKQGKKKIIFETARQITSEQKKELEDFGKKGDIIKEKISPKLIAGIRIIINGSKQLDNSLLSKINNLL